MKGEGGQSGKRKFGGIAEEMNPAAVCYRLDWQGENKDNKSTEAVQH